MFRRITMFNGKRILVHSLKNCVIDCFNYAMKYYTKTGTTENKTTYTIKFNNGLYDYTFIMPKEYINNLNGGK